MVSFEKKIQATITSALLFYVISSPFTYHVVDSMVGSILEFYVPSFKDFFKIAEKGCPTNYGLFVHSVVFAIIVYHLMD